MSSNAAYDAQSRRPQIIIGTVIPSLIGTIFVFARCLTRLLITHNWGADDTLIFVSWLAIIPLVILQCLSTNHGQGRHTSVLKFPDIIIALKMLYAIEILYVFIITTTKLGLCVFYLRIFRDKRSKQFIWAILVLILLLSIPLMFLTVFQCSPITGAWNIALPATCNYEKITISCSTVNILIDVLLIAFTVPRIFPLTLPIWQKISLLGVVSLGFVVMACSAVRVVRVKEVFASQDKFWVSYDINAWTCIEINVGLLCACAPTLKPLLRRISPDSIASFLGSGPGLSRSSRRKMSACRGSSNLDSGRKFSNARKSTINEQDMELENIE